MISVALDIGYSGQGLTGQLCKTPCLSSKGETVSHSGHVNNGEAPIREMAVGGTCVGVSRTWFSMLSHRSHESKTLVAQDSASGTPTETDVETMNSIGWDESLRHELQPPV